MFQWNREHFGTDGSFSLQRVRLNKRTKYPIVRSYNKVMYGNILT